MVVLSHDTDGTIATPDYDIIWDSDSKPDLFAVTSPSIYLFLLDFFSVSLLVGVVHFKGFLRL